MRFPWHQAAVLRQGGGGSARSPRAQPGPPSQQCHPSKACGCCLLGLGLAVPYAHGRWRPGKASPRALTRHHAPQVCPACPQAACLCGGGGAAGGTAATPPAGARRGWYPQRRMGAALLQFPRRFGVLALPPSRCFGCAPPFGRSGQQGAAAPVALCSPHPRPRPPLPAHAWQASHCTHGPWTPCTPGGSAGRPHAEAQRC